MPEAAWKETPLGRLPSSWDVAHLDDAAAKIQDGTHFSPKTMSGPRRYLTSKNIRFGFLDLTDSGWISEKEHADIYRRCDVQFGDVLLTKDGANTGNAALNSLTEAFSLLSSVAMIRCKPGYSHNGYVLQYILSDSGQKRLKDLMSGNAITRLTLDKIKRFQVPVPSFIEQSRIAEILDTLDAAIRETEAGVAKLRQVKAGLLHDLLTCGLDENGCLRDGERHPERFQGFLLGRVPSKWGVRCFDEVCCLIKDGTHQPPKRVSSGPLLLGVQNIIAGHLQRTDADTRISWQFYHEMHSRWTIEVGDVLLAIVGATIGKVCQVPSGFEPFTIQRSVALLRTKPEKMEARFLLHFISSQIFQNAIRLKTNTTAQPGLYLAQIGQFLAPIPPVEEQRRVCAVLDATDERIALTEKESSKLCALKCGLANDLLTGRVRVKV